MDRRQFLKLMGWGTVALSSSQLPAFAQQGTDTPVETAINSRCSSDDDGNPKSSHWGIYDTSRTPNAAQLNTILNATKIPRFTKKLLNVEGAETLTFSIDAATTGHERDWLWIESGMQQQAVHLICAALGLGTCIHGAYGVDGSRLSPTQMGTVQMVVGCMRASFNGNYWSSAAPTDVKPWLTGNLPDPKRTGSKPLIQVITNLKTAVAGNAPPNLKATSQLLWAARGRTPHYVLGRPWGLTIPTWGGDERITSVYTIASNGTFKYINWDNQKDQPTHSIEQINTNGTSRLTSELKLKTTPNYCIVLATNEQTGRAFWEIGYELENMLVQAAALQLCYSAILLDETQRKNLKNFDIPNAAALVIILWSR